MEEIKKDLEQKKSKLLVWIIVIVILLVVVIGGAYLWANKPYEKTVKNNKTTGDSEEVLGVKSACTNEAEVRSSRDNPNGPISHSVYSATSVDGMSWVADNKLIFNEASVPGAVIREGIIYLYFVDASGKEDQLSVAISSDLGKSYEKFKVNVDGMASYDAVDPHPELIEGKISLYYLGDFMCMMNDLKDQKFRMYSSTSTDGINFTNQALNYTFDEITTDPDVFKVGDSWKMLVSQEHNMKLLSSTDSKEFVLDETFEWDKGGVSDTFNFDGEYRTYYCDKGISYGIGVDSGSITTEGVAFESKTKDIVCDPSIIELPDGRYKMYYKTEKLDSDNPPISPPT